MGRLPRLCHVFATVFVKGEVELEFLVVAQHLGGHERADVHAHAVVQVGVPADRLPADEDVVADFAIEFACPASCAP